MAGTQTAAVPFTVFRVLQGSDNLPTMDRMAEKAALTVNFGTPVVLSAGYLIERGAISSVATAIVAGVTTEVGHNLAADGTAPVGGSGLTYGKVVNQPAAVNIPIGAPMADGQLGIVLASDENIFQGKTDSAHTTAVTDVGTLVGLTKDATTGNWFVDTTIVTAATGALVEITDVIELGVAGGRVAFRFARASQQMFQ